MSERGREREREREGDNMGGDVIEVTRNKPKIV